MGDSRIYVKAIILLFCLSILPLFLLLSVNIVLSQFLVDPITYSRTTGLFEISQIRFYLATTIVNLPLITFLLLFLRKDFRKDTNLLGRGVFKFFYYLFFIFPAILATGYLISIVSSALEGSLTPRPFVNFFAIILLFLPGLFFVSMSINRGRISLSSLSLLLGYYLLISISVFVLAFSKLGPPWLPKNIREDNQKITIAKEVSAKVQDYYYRFKKLPTNLDELENTFSDSMFLKEASENYSYSITGDKNYRLCTSFYMSSQGLEKYGYTSEPEYQHERGQSCLNFEVSAEFCRTLNTRMVTDFDGRGQIGCDIKANGQVDLSKSFCESQKTNKKEFLVPDAYGRKDQYFATLTGLDLDEEVKVFAYTKSGTKIECLPSLNK